jgi:spermidine/putrescine transport system substrate-binding protein
MAAGGVGAAAWLAACSKPTGITKSQAAKLNLPARPFRPVQLPVDQNALIEDGLPSEAGPLKIYNWSAYINPATVKAAEKALGVPVQVTTFTTLDEAISKLQSGQLEQDIFFPTNNIVSQMQFQKIIAPLNHSYLPNLTNIWDSLGGSTNPADAAKAPFYDQGSRYTVPYTIYTTGIAYRVDQGPNAHIQMNLAPLEQTIPALPVPYDILWDTTYKGFVHLLDDTNTINLAILRNDIHAGKDTKTVQIDVNTDDPATRTKVLGDARDSLIEWQHTMQGQMDVTDYTDLPEGRSYIHEAWSGDLISAQYYYASWSPRDIIRYWAPPKGSKYGPLIGDDCIAILANAKNPVLAHKFLNFMLDFDNAMGNFTWTGYQPPQKNVDPFALLKNSPTPLKPYNVIPPSLENAVVTEDMFKTGYQYLELSPAVNNEWTNAWEAVQTA